MERKQIKESDFPAFLKHEYPNDPAWKAFFKLWMDAKGFEYGDRDQHIVDGFGDGGIDAIAYPPHGLAEQRITVIQSKYHLRNVPEKCLLPFLNAVRAFRSDSKVEFEKWINKVKRNQLKTTYRDLWPKRHMIQFVLVTSGTIRKETLYSIKRLGIHFEDKKRVKAIFQDIIRGKSPRPETIRLSVRSSVSRILKTEKHGMHVFSAALSDFQRAYQSEKKNLFAGNVRYALPGRTEVKIGIKDTLQNNAREFVYFHNGITIICKKLVKKGNRVVLHSPSIVNGAQTVSYIGESNIKEIANASVLVKVIEVTAEGGFEQYETDVAMSSNTQNKVSLSDLAVIDPDLVRLERFFRISKCFLERKKGSTALGSVVLKINKDRLLQLLTAIDSFTGPSVTKDKQNLYKHHSGRLFKEYAASLTRKRDAVFIAMLDALAKYSLKQFKLAGKSGKRKKNRLSLSYFTIFNVLITLLRIKGKWRPVKQAFSADGIWDNQYSLALERDIKIIAKAILAEAKRDPDRNETAFFKSREKVRWATARVVRRLRAKVVFHRAA